MNTGVDSELVKVVQEHVRKLSSDVATMSFESQEQINNVNEMLTNIQLDFEKRVQQLEHKQAILQREQDILQHEQGILQREQDILQHEQDILKKRQNNVEQRVTCWKQEAQDKCRSCTYAYLFD
jgi:Skp family chaperone for outer membrane proteins